MKRKLLTVFLPLCILFFYCTGALAQTARKPVELVQEALQARRHFAPVDMQAASLATDAYRGRLAQQVSNFALFRFNPPAGSLPANGTALQLIVPLPEGALTLQLVPVNIYADGFSVVTSSGERIKASGGQHYQGIVKGNTHSIAAISIYDNEIAGFISTGAGNFVVGRLRNTGDKEPVHIVYKESALLQKQPMNCSTPDIALPVPPPAATALTNRCVRMYFETEYDFFQNLGSAAAVTNYVTNLFNQIKTLYNNDGVSVALSEILVWQSTDPYNGTNSGSLLAEFQSVRTSFNGDVGQLITTRNIGGGQAAVIYGLCSSIQNRLCVSGDLGLSFPNVPTYSWEVMVTTHEFGHLLGSRHTHACVWNGNNTAIDGCAGGTEGGCSTPGYPAGGGTIMSYCHLQSVGINFNNGFGPQPAAKIRNSVEASTCLGSCNEPPQPCSEPLTGLIAYNVGETQATVAWPTPNASISSYTIEYKAAGSSTWISAGTIPAPPFWGSIQLTGLSPATTYDWRVKANCKSGLSSPYAQSQFTTLETGVPCGTPTGLIGSPDCFFSDVSWNAVPDAQSYTVEARKSTTPTWSVIESATTYTSATIYGTPGLYYWRVKVNCAGGTGNYANGTTSIRPYRVCEEFRTAKAQQPGKELAAGNALRLQPQPATGLVTVLYVAPAKATGTITVFNQFGSPALRKNIQVVDGSNQFTLDISKLTPGVYMTRLEADGIMVSGKLVVGSR